MFTSVEPDELDEGPEVDVPMIGPRPGFPNDGLCEPP